MWLSNYRKHESEIHLQKQATVRGQYTTELQECPNRGHTSIKIIRISIILSMPSKNISAEKDLEKITANPTASFYRWTNRSSCEKEIEQSPAQQHSVRSHGRARIKA